MRYGLDFGTSNSAVALWREGKVELAPVDEAAPNAGTVRTLLWIPRSGEKAIGEGAVSAFVSSNAGRQISKSRVWSNDLILTEFGDEYIQFDADTGIPGRFFQALKSALADATYAGTDVFGTPYTLEELIAAILREMKTRADRYYGQEVDRVTLGRPVHFSREPEGDQLAEGRLRRAAELAGFRDIAFVYEPLGAAFHYETRLSHEELALVFDLGGGTLDLSLVRLGPQRRGRPNRHEDVLAVGGVVLGGNTFNEDIMEQRLMRYFGQRATWRSERGQDLPMPAHIFAHLRTWYTISLLNERAVMKLMQEALRSTNQPRQLEALLCLIVRNYGWGLFQEIERGKCALSTERHTRLQILPGGHRHRGTADAHGL